MSNNIQYLAFDFQCWMLGVNAQRGVNSTLIVYTIQPYLRKVEVVSVMINNAVGEKVYKAIQDCLGKKLDIQDSQTFVGDLGFDSLRIATLSLCLENEFGKPILLIDWLSVADTPESLHVGSLVNYIHKEMAWMKA